MSEEVNNEIEKKEKKIDYKIVVISLLSIIIIALIAFIYILNNKVNKLNSYMMGGAPYAQNARPREMKKPSEYKVGIDYNNAIKQNKPVLVLFYADWCGYCQRFMPIFEKVAKANRNKITFSKVNVEDEKYSELVKKMNIQGFPTVYIIDKNGKNTLVDNYELQSYEQLNTVIKNYLKK